MLKFDIQFGIAGFCTAKAHHAMQGADKQDIRFYAMYALITHPELGYILFDAGYARRFYKATTSWPNRIYALIAPPIIMEEDEIIYQLSNIGIHSSEIKIIILSHFHGDHTGGLIDFPEATIYCSQKAFNHINGLDDYFAFSKGVLKELHPKDIVSRIKFIEEFEPMEDLILGTGFAFLNDHRMLIFDLPGHAAGQIGLLIDFGHTKYFLIADAAWHIEAVTDLKLPSPLVRLFFDSWSDYKNTLKKLNLFHTDNTDVMIIPSHCAKTLHKLGLINESHYEV